MATERLRLGELLVDAGLITQETLEAALAEQRRVGRRLGALLVESGQINETELTQILSHQLSVPWVSLLHIEFSRQLLNLVPRETAESFNLIPIFVRHVRGQGQTLYVAMEDPTNESGLEEVASFAGLPVRAMIAAGGDIRSAIRVYYGGAEPTEAPTSVPPMSRRPDTDRAARRSDIPPRKGTPPPFETPVRAPSVPDIPVPEADEAAPVPSPASRRGAERLQALVASQAVPEGGEEPTSEPPTAEIPVPKKGRGPRMVSLTLLDGTAITLPAKGKRASPEAPAGADVALTARDLVAALRAVSHGADATEILGDEVRWESLFAALLSLLLRKHLIADWEFVDEYTKI